jgi:hypothetical protein
MALESLSSMPAIFGMTQSGGKPKSRKTSKTSKTSKTTVRKTKKSAKRGGVMGDKTEYQCWCEDKGKVPKEGNVEMGVENGLELSNLRPNGPPKPETPVPNGQPNGQPKSETRPRVLYPIQSGQSDEVKEGGMSKMQYKAYLAKMDVKRLYKMAKNKGIKITKKKDGKTTYIKKDTVIQKLCDAMHGKKK